MKKFAVITSIFAPTTAIKKFSNMTGWQLIVVGDKKTPRSWIYPNVIYLTPEFQTKKWKSIGNMIPWNNYGRKTLGYLYAIEQKADVIADVDDDNIPHANWAHQLPFEGAFQCISSGGFYNVYSYFTKKHIWPRGFPLQYVNKTTNIRKITEKRKIGIWQYLANEDADVDAIYRLIDNSPVYFEDKKPIVLANKTVCPYNAQNSVIRKELFPLLYMPSYVTMRFTDILRGLINQPILWKHGYSLGFAHATVTQKRNPHNYLHDFELEIPSYLHSEDVIKIASDALKPKTSITEDLYSCYKALIKQNIVSDKELPLLLNWLSYFL